MTVIKITPWYLLDTRVDSTGGPDDLKKIKLTRPAGIKTQDHKALDHVPILTSIYSPESYKPTMNYEEYAGSGYLQLKSTTRHFRGVVRERKENLSRTAVISRDSKMVASE
jgi:hypothetical protein